MPNDNAICPGKPYPHRVSRDGDGVNFALSPEHAERIELSRLVLARWPIWPVVPRIIAKAGPDPADEIVLTAK